MRSLCVAIVFLVILSAAPSQAMDPSQTETVNGHKAIAGEILIKFNAAIEEKQGIPNIRTAGSCRNAEYC